MTRPYTYLTPRSNILLNLRSFPKTLPFNCSRLPNLDGRLPLDPVPFPDFILQGATYTAIVVYHSGLDTDSLPLS